MKARLRILLVWTFGAASFAAAEDGPAPLPKLPPVKPAPPAVPVVPPVPDPQPAIPVPEPIAPATGPGAESGYRVISPYGNFRVTGGELPQRKSIVMLLEQTRVDLQHLLGEDQNNPDKKKSGQPAPLPMVPIDVVLDGKPGDAPREKSISYDLRYADGVFLLGMRLNLARGIDNDELDHATLTLLLYERALRGIKPAELEGRLVVRPWLVEGLRETREWREDRGNWQLFQGVLKAGGGFTLDELFEMSDEKWEGLDPSSRASFRALSGATVMALLGQTKGDESFRGFVGEAARNAGEMTVLLRKYFPDLNLSEKSLAKWVQLTLAEKAQPKLTEAMSVLDTERGLDDALKLHYRDKDGNALERGLDAWQEVAAMKPPERVAAVRIAQDSLVRLSFRCFPSYRQTLTDYGAILTDLAKGDTRKIAQRLVELNDEREVMRKRAERARDYMNYFEISRAREVSGHFDDYMKLKKELDERSRGDRTDRMSKALDVIDASYEPKKKR